MSFVTFAQSLFSDTSSLMKLVQKRSSQQLSKIELEQFANSVKRCKQTCDDWELFCSLQDFESSDPNKKLRTSINSFFQEAVKYLKSQDSNAPIEVSKKYNSFCKSLYDIIGFEDAKQVEGLISVVQQFDKTSDEMNSDNGISPSRESIIDQLKSLAMAALLHLKELSRIVIHSIRSRESTAQHFAVEAKSTIEKTKMLVDFANQFQLTKEGDLLTEAVKEFVNHSKDVFIRPLPPGPEQDILQSQLEQKKSHIAVCIRNILQLITQKVNEEPKNLVNTSNESTESLPMEKITINDSVEDPSTPIVEHVVISQPTNTESTEKPNSDSDKVDTPKANQPQEITLTEKQLKRLEDRKHAFEEIGASEKIYFGNLQFVFWGIITPLEQEISSKSGIISQQELNEMFSNWKSLMNFNKELMKGLEKRRDIPIEERMVGDTFLELIPLMKMYTEFVNNFEKSNAVAMKCLERDSFYTFIDNCLKSAPNTNLNLSSYLIMPVQRLPRYEMLLRALLKLTEPHHPDYNNLEIAVQKVKAINDHVNLKKKEAENRALVYGVQERIHGFNNLVQPSRLFIREGDLQFSNYANPKKTKKRDTFHFFLFNDLLLKTKLNKKNFFDVKDSFELTKYSFRDVTYSPFMGNAERFCFRLVLQTDERSGVSFYASSAEEKAQWAVDLEEAISTRDAADSTRYV